ncbi:YbaB/EbfC family nucleoid-associated protein [Actinophytocola algeriensis]|uniref:DNA-binding protein YbaB n=1 Tax=Actinophytocola algeriensis TaxID=1768010 RepID=A0A7W7Q3R3_9PSEU|nr:YbaB/EbfC family nucleoid-associated protein [Actinophytocola algeriensis]MBB4906399.1 DNA-binding protein YbaB [Actinophytocola algeriensis]MBE1477880.1 DNA-binding protein YbaB [Actinophytocola algeriensis]
MTTPAGFEELHRLAGEAARFARIFSVEQDAEKTFTGHDETELVTVAVNADGQVTDVELAPDWDRTIDPRKLGATVAEAVNAATANRVTEWADRVAEAGAEPDEPAPPRTPAPVTINPSAAAIEDLLYLLHRVGQETNPSERGRRRAPEPALPALVKGKSDGGHVVVALNGTTVAEVRVETNTMWIGGANHLEVASELHSAFEAAYRRAAEEAPVRRTDSAVAELQARTADPQEFVARLFGLDR